MAAAHAGGPAEAAHPQVERGALIYLAFSAEDANGVEHDTFGTGFFVGGAGNVLTAYHLLTDLGSFRPSTLQLSGYIKSKQGQKVSLDIVVPNEDRDLLLLNITDSVNAGPSLCLDPYHAAVEGESIYTAGFPSTLPFVSPGGELVSAQGENDTWIVSAAINPGQSGSPVFDDAGNVIAIAKGQVSDDKGNAVADQYVVVPISDAPRIDVLSRIGCKGATAAAAGTATPVATTIKATPPDQPAQTLIDTAGWVQYGTYANAAWVERDFASASGPADKLPAVGDSITAGSDADVYVSPVQQTPQGTWEKQKVLGATTAGSLLRVLAVQFPYPGAVWVKVASTTSPARIDPLKQTSSPLKPFIDPKIFILPGTPTGPIMASKSFTGKAFPEFVYKGFVND